MPPAQKNIERLLLILISLWLGAVLIFPVFTNDIWFHLKLGQTIWLKNGIPRFDLFSDFTRQQPWAVNAWLFDLSAWLLYRLAGLNALVLARLVLALSAAGLMFSLARKKGAGLVLTALVVFLVFGFTRLSWVERPQTVSFFLFAVGLWVLEMPEPPGRRAGLFALSVVWANLHSTVVLWVAVLAVWQCGRILDRGEWKAAAWDLGLSAAAAC
jgi:hypothetical protein